MEDAGGSASAESGTIPVAVGQVVAGKYRIDHVLGQGAMGVVVRATHLQLDQPVAIKFLSIAATDYVRERFVREARAAAKLRGEHVGRVSDVATLDSGEPFIVMEYLEGEDLDRALRQRGPLPVQEVTDYVLQACEGLAEAHAAGIVHRDIKPANLFLARAPDGTARIKVVDFGISKDLASSEGGMALTGTSAMLGSPLYMSPEQMRSARQVDARTDIWSLGVVLYQLLTGRPPFAGETLPELVLSIDKDVPASPRELRTDVPSQLDAIVMRCLQKDPTARFASVAGLATALAPFASAEQRAVVPRVARMLGESVPEPAASDASRAGVGPTLLMSELAPEPPAATVPGAPALTAQESLAAEAPPKRPYRAWVVAALGLAVAVGVVGVVLLRDGEDVVPTPAPTATPSSVVGAADRCAPAGEGAAVMLPGGEHLGCRAQHVGGQLCVRCEAREPFGPVQRFELLHPDPRVIEVDVREHEASMAAPLARGDHVLAQILWAEESRTLSVEWPPDEPRPREGRVEPITVPLSWAPLDPRCKLHDPVYLVDNCEERRDLGWLHQELGRLREHHVEGVVTLPEHFELGTEPEPGQPHARVVVRDAHGRRALVISPEPGPLRLLPAERDEVIATLWLDLDWRWWLAHRDDEGRWRYERAEPEPPP